MLALTPEQWKQITPYLDHALSLPAEQRKAWLESIRDEQPQNLALLMCLLEEHSLLTEEHFMERSPERPGDGPSWAGQVMGAYTLLSPVGRGGMSSVWLATRNDGRFERQVAVKILHFAVAVHGGAERFKREGKVLGRLAHPHIAELIDAGVAANGQPYLVLEYIEGEQIDQYCDRHKLEIDERIRLFLDVLAAVALAHANLIVHRDIKPSNVLVRSDGQVKLLDFGIAKLLGEQQISVGEATLTIEGGSALTPQFAAPEQITAGAITTTTDTYSLGVLLYLLLTGQHPAGGDVHTPAMLVQAILEKEPPRPSDVVLNGENSFAETRGTTPEKLRRRLRGDLDTIVGKALKKNPRERYASVTVLADDLQRYLKHVAISARPDTLAYRASKFVRRNRTALASTTAAILLIIASLAMGLYLANRERRIAERRFVQVRQLANKFIELDNDVRGLPGATAARRKMVSSSLEYLSSQEKEVHGDKDLALELAFASIRVAHVQGDPTSPNLGQFDDAETTLQKAEKLIAPVLAAEPRNRRALFMSATIAHDRMMLAHQLGRGAETVAWARTAAQRVETFMSLGNVEPKDVYSMTYFDVNVSYGYEMNRHFDEAIRAGNRALEISQLAPRAKQLHGEIFKDLGYALWQSGDLDGSLQQFHRAIELDEKEAAKGHVALRFNLADGLRQEGMLLGKADGEPSLGRTEDALSDFRKALAIADELAQNDADDYMSREGVAENGFEIGNILRHREPKEALAMYDHALSRIREAKPNPSAQRHQVELLAASSYPLRWMGRKDEAQGRIDDALRLLRGLHYYLAVKIEPMSITYQTARAVADNYAETGRTSEAIAAYQALLDQLMAWHPDLQNDLRDATCISRTWTALASLQQRAGGREEAAKLEAQRAELWSDWKSKLPNGQFLLRQSAVQISSPLLPARTSDLPR